MTLPLGVGDMRPSELMDKMKALMLLLEELERLVLVHLPDPPC